ncbi:MAG: hypothetical protein ACO32I_07145 [Candidatus Limnocylindrus sp.]
MEVLINGKPYVSLEKLDKELRKELIAQKREIKLLTRSLKYRDAEIERLNRTTTTAQLDKAKEENERLSSELERERSIKRLDADLQREARVKLEVCERDLYKTRLALMNSWGPGEWFGHIKMRWESRRDEWLKKYPGVPVMPETERGWFIDSIVSLQYDNAALRSRVKDLTAEIEALKKERED